MKKVFLLFAAFCLAIAGNAQITTFSSNDANLDGKVDVDDVNSVISEMCGESSGKQVTEAGALTVDPYAVDNSLITGTWYKTKAESATFNADGTQTYLSGYTYQFFPYQGQIVFYDSLDVESKSLRVWNIKSDYLVLGNSSPVRYTKTQPVQLVTSIKLSKTTLYLQPKAYEQINATVSPSNADDASVTWTSSNTSVATVMGGIVLAVAEGTATITCEANDDSGVKATCEVTVRTDKSGTIDGKQYVDLGLPSGTLWATCNVGATSPEDYGLYFAWGETTGYTSDTSDGHSFDWASYKWCNGSYDSQTKYCTSSSDGTVDNKTELEASDDAATANWGSNWQMPSYDQITELYNSTYTTTTWTTQNGVKGRLITSKTNGNTIFLPAAGYRYDARLNLAGSYGLYWSRSLSSYDSNYAYYLFFGLNYVDWDNYNRCYGRGVRPVRVQN